MPVPDVIWANGDHAHYHRSSSMLAIALDYAIASMAIAMHYLISDYMAHWTTFAQSLCNNLPPHMKTMET
jgi:hypothetical protein